MNNTPLENPKKSQDAFLSKLVIVLAVLLILLCAATYFLAQHQKEDGQTDATSQNTSDVAVTTGASTPALTAPPTDTPASASTDAPTDAATDAPTDAPTDAATDAPTAPPVSDTVAPPATENDTPVYIPQDSTAKLPEGTAQDGYLSRIVFLGDSTTYGLRAYGLVDKSQVWTPKSGTLTLSYASTSTISCPQTGTELLIKDAVAAVKPDILVITLGVNGVSFMGEDYFKTEYRKMVTSIQENSPDTTIIINSVYPVAKSYPYIKSISNEKIAAANRWLVSIAEECGVWFTDSYSVLVGADGALPENLHNGDGIHLNPTGYGLVLDYLKSHPCP